MNKIIGRTLSWRILASATTASITYLVTGSFAATTSVVFAEFVLKWFLQIGHDFVWNKYAP